MKMRLIQKTSLGIAIIALLTILGGSCRGSRTENVLRLIQVLDKSNIVRSPLIHLEESFVPVTQKVRAEDFQRIVVNGETYWAFASMSPLVTLADELVPEKATLRQGKTEFRFSDVPLPSYPTWRRIKGEVSVEMAGAQPDHDFKGWYKLPRGRSLRASRSFPAGPALFELAVRSGDPGRYRPRLSISVNGRPHEFQVGSSPHVRFLDECSPGENAIQVSYEDSAAVPGALVRPKDEFVLVQPIRVSSNSDLILMSLPEGQQAPAGTYDFSFVPEPRDLFVPVNRNLNFGQEFRSKIETLSAGPTSVELSGESLSGPGRVELSVDSRPSGSRSVLGGGSFVCAVTMSAPRGVHDFKIVFQAEGAPTRRSSPAADVRLDSLVWRNPINSTDSVLYRLKNVDLREEGIVSNPWNIKKKLKVRGGSWNVIAAPSTTILQFQVKVPEKGMLRFGYGLYREAEDSAGDGVEFHVAAESGGRKRDLFSAVLDPSHKPADRRVLFKDIDLTAYAGRSVKLSFTTHSAPSRVSVSDEAQDLRNDFAFWINPILFCEDIPRARERKNVILISMDAVRPDHLGCYGYGRDTTPTVDSLAKDGTLFLNTISQASYTLASHMTMLTGLFPTTHHVLHMTDALDPSLPNLAERLQADGLLTAAFTGGGLMDARYGYAKGFDEYHDRIIAQEAPDVAGPLWRTVSAWLNRNKDLNFFLFLHTYQAHEPYRAPAPLGTMFLDKDAVWSRTNLEQFIGAGYVHKYAPLPEPQRRNVIALYDGGIRYLDENLIRPLVDELKRLGLYDNTLLIVTADHGEEFFDHLTWGHSNTLYNELLRVPLVMKFPRGQFRGQRVTPNARLVDIVPTVLDEFGLARWNKKLDGESLIPMIENKETKDRFCLSYIPDNIFADPMPAKISLIQGRYKIIVNDKYPARAATYFTPLPPPLAPVELFDLKNDPLERHNLINEQGDIARRMLGLLRPYIQAAKRSGPGAKATIDKELEERLRALGYVK